MSPIKFPKVRIIYKYVYNRVEYFVIRYLLTISWPLFVKYFAYKANKSELVVPKANRFKSATILCDSPESPEIQISKAWRKRGVITNSSHFSLIHLKAAKSWAESTLKIDNVQFSSDLDSIRSDVLIITGDWLKSKNAHLKFFIPVFKAARKLKSGNIPVWFMQGDTYRLETIIPASILVANCGGAVVLQQSTKNEASKFGIPFPFGPHIWTLNPGNQKMFRSNINWRNREQIIIMAASGDNRRQELYNEFADQLKSAGWKVLATKQQYSWEDYKLVNKKSKVNVNTSLLQEVVVERLGLVRDRASKYTVTHRVFEGFCSGAVIVTNSNPILLELGFKVNEHYLDLDQLILNGFKLPSERVLEKVARAGNLRFQDLISGQPNYF
jgi:hypothetical protein